MRWPQRARSGRPDQHHRHPGRRPDGHLAGRVPRPRRATGVVPVRPAHDTWHRESSSEPPDGEAAASTPRSTRRRSPAEPCCSSPDGPFAGWTAGHSVQLTWNPAHPGPADGASTWTYGVVPPDIPDGTPTRSRMPATATVHWRATSSTAGSPRTSASRDLLERVVLMSSASYPDGYHPLTAPTGVLMPDQTDITDFDPHAGRTTTTVVATHTAAAGRGDPRRQQHTTRHRADMPSGVGDPAITKLTAQTVAAAAGATTVTVTGTVVAARCSSDRAADQSLATSLTTVRRSRRTWRPCATPNGRGVRLRRPRR